MPKNLIPFISYIEKEPIMKNNLIKLICAVSIFFALAPTPKNKTEGGASKAIDSKVDQAMKTYKAYLAVKAKIAKAEAAAAEAKQSYQHKFDQMITGYLPTFCSTAVGATGRAEKAACKKVEADENKKALPLLAKATVF